VAATYEGRLSGGDRRKLLEFLMLITVGLEREPLVTPLFIRASCVSLPPFSFEDCMIASSTCPKEKHVLAAAIAPR
jgi:hypothetical protein